MAKCRVTMRSGRVGSAQHNDRAFLKGREDQAQEVAPHIDLERSGDNRVISWQGAKGEGKPLEQTELEFYEMRFGAMCKQRNEMYRKQGHKERCKTPEDLYRGRLTRPEELILQVGDMHNHASADELWDMTKAYLNEFMEWNKEHGSHGHILSVALHTDETTPHVHIRRVWDYEKDGTICLGQNKALEASGVALPDESKPEGRYNNRKMTFDDMMRGKWQEICKARGFEIETEPRPSLKHKDKADYIADQLDKQIKAKETELSGLSEKVSEARKLEAKADRLKSHVDELQSVERILSKAEVGKVVKEAKTGLFDKDKVTIDRKDFEALARTAHGAEEAIEQARTAARKKRQAEIEAEKVIADAKNKADAIISKADSVWKNSAINQLKELKEDYPQIFNANGVYQRGHEIGRMTKNISHDIGKDISR